MDECHECGEEYRQLSQHWRCGSCSRPEITDYQWEILTGLMLGDARLVRKQGRNPYLVLSNTCKEFVEWFNGVMGVLVTGVREHGEPREDNHSQCYVCSTRCHPGLDRFADWYDDDGGSKVPQEYELTPMIAKCWYVSDGTVLTPSDTRPTVRFCSRKPKEVKQEMRESFEEIGFHPTWSNTQLFFNADESRELLEWMGDPLPGFQYKWPDDPDLQNTYSMPEKRQWKNRDEFEKLRYERGMSYAMMAAEWDCSTSTIHEWDRRHGFVK